MTTLAIALAKIAVLEARLDALEGGRGASSSSGASSAGAGGGEALPDHLLDNAWADKTIAKDPKQWKGPTQVNRRFSRAPAEWLDMAASNMEFKAQKEREAVPVALQTTGKNAGKPWHESTTFNAKLLRAWARRNATKAAVKPAEKPSAQSQDDDFSFGANVPAADDDVGF